MKLAELERKRDLALYRWLRDEEATTHYLAIARKYVNLVDNILYAKDNNGSDKA